MFFNQYDIVKAGGLNQLVLSVENETLILLDVNTLNRVEVSKVGIERVSTMSDIRTKAIYEASIGTITKPTHTRNILDYLKKCEWIEGAALNHQASAWLYSAIESMVTLKTLKDGVTEAFFEKADNLIKVGRTSVVVSGKHKGADMAIKLTLVNKNNVVSVNNVKRIFGDDGVFGNIKKSANTVATKNPTTNTRRTIQYNQKSSLAS